MAGIKGCLSASLFKLYENFLLDFVVVSLGIGTLWSRRVSNSNYTEKASST